ncbi:1,2-dihydroxy-3-keto-5-methylthiopentene dioxygenase [Mycena kentingensis (nom. inval.)]|nr:1,2-dihydroxy-3-keto-5-methylthiopentene dioxygenase [Mycena kentingensis (nom. inval.)]
MDLTHGIVFTPQSVSQPKSNPYRVLDDPSIKYVRIYWVDWTNLRRCRIVPIAHFKALLASNRPGVNVAKVLLGFVYLQVAPLFSEMGEYLYAIDMDTLRPCPWAPGHWAVLGRFEEKAPIGTLSVITVDLCPRTILRRITDTIKHEYGTDFIIGFESEFILLSSQQPVTASNLHHFAASAALFAGSREAIVLEEIADAVTASGIKLEMIHAEAAPGQYEVVVGPLTPVEAADAFIHTNEIIAQVAAKHGLHATFAPRPFMHSIGSSAHAHLSVHSAEDKVGGRLAIREAQFLAGVLEHLRGIVALTLPTSASYKRVGDGVWSGGTYVCYGTENREAPVRLTNIASPGSRNFELRFIDGTANPHLALAAILAGGLLGFKKAMELTTLDCPGPKSAAQLSDAERATLGINKRLPLSAEEGRTSLESDNELSGILGKEFVQKYLSVNRLLDSLLVPQGETEEEQLTRLVKYY